MSVCLAARSRQPFPRTRDRRSISKSTDHHADVWLQDWTYRDDLMTSTLLWDKLQAISARRFAIRNERNLSAYLPMDNNADQPRVPAHRSQDGADRERDRRRFWLDTVVPAPEKTTLATIACGDVRSSTPPALEVILFLSACDQSRSNLLHWDYGLLLLEQGWVSARSRC
jgi:hypothetical protein